MMKSRVVLGEKELFVNVQEALMARKIINKFFTRESNASQSMIQPNDSLNLSELSKYTQVMTSKDDEGYKGLKLAFENQLTVSITVENDDKTTAVISGVISHYDENFKQLLVNMNSQLKRIVFNQIVDVDIQEKKTNTELV